MRLGDLDALRNEVDTWGCNDYDKYDFIEAIDNAPTVDAKTTHDVSSAYDRGYITAMKEYSRPQGECNCSHCDYWKFSRAIIHGFVDYMVTHGIESIEELEEELHRMNQGE